MSTETDYVTQTELNAYVKSPRSAPDANLAAAITAGSRAADAYCGRFFYTAEQTQYFRVDPANRDYLWTLSLDDMDIANFDDGDSPFQVATETGNDGTYPAIWTPNVDFIGEPVNQSQNGIVGWPYTSLRAISGRVWPINFTPWQRPTVMIHANFGWTDVPEPVKQATKIISAQFWKLGEAALGVAGFNEFGPVRVRDIPQAVALLMPYRKGTTFGVA